MSVILDRIRADRLPTSGIVLDGKEYDMYLNLQGALEITYMDSTQQNLTLYLSRTSATIKQHISTPLVHPLIVMVPKHVLVMHRAHCFIVNVQPSFPTITVPVRM